MRNFILIALSILVFSCTSSEKEMEKVTSLYNNGNYSEARAIINEYLNSETKDSATIREYLHLMDFMHRMERDFSKSHDEVKTELREYYPEITESMIDAWAEKNELERIVIDGEKRYFYNAVPNLFRINRQAGEYKDSIKGKQISDVTVFKNKYLPEYFEKGMKSGEPFDTREILINYTISVDKDAVPEGEIVRCWLPFPRISGKALSNVKLLSTSQNDYITAPEETLQRSIYMEKKAVKDSATVFSIEYVIETSAVWYDMDNIKVLPYDKDSELYQEYTSERLPQITFSDRIKNLAKEIVGDETNPVEQVRKLYYWNNANIPWASALEYSLMPCIPEYVLDNKSGDCGMQTLLFISMARSLGIPVKWQSGWYLLPTTKNLHDWAEVYYQGVGWVPVDVSFNLTESEDKRVKDFYLSGLDSYRLIINDDYSQEFYPPKKYFRSEPVDFQRGEVEWKGGNLYFDQWSYSMKFEYLD